MSWRECVVNQKKRDGPRGNKYDALLFTSLLYHQAMGIRHTDALGSVEKTGERIGGEWRKKWDVGAKEQQQQQQDIENKK
jgi:hypothetical protein